MLKLVVISLTVECRTLQFPRNLYQNDSAFSVIFTQAGFNKFALKYLTNNDKIIGRKLPDQIFKINLGPTSIDLQLTDMFISDFQVTKAYIIMDGDSRLVMNIVNASAAISLQWRFQQSSYPYIHDQGSGKISIKEVSFHLTMSTKCTYDDCPNRVVSDVSNVQIEIGIINIQLSGGESWIYQSMIDIVIGAVKDSLVATIQDFIKETLIYELNSIFIYYRPTMNYENYPDVVKDERQVTGWYVGKGFGAMMYSGYLYNQNNYSDEYVSVGMIEPMVMNRFNHDMQVYLHAAGFNNLYYIFHKYYDSYSTADFKVLSAPYVEFYNQQALLTIDLLFNEQQYTIQFTGQPKATFKDKQNCFYFTLQKYDIYPSNDELNNQVLSFLNEQMKSTCYQMMNTPFFDVSTLPHVFVQEENALRFLGNLI
ncbi:BPI-like_protein [Hexamita inflata]|uniref:BPI-like protein n=1 Tax=Hexamita inflata TaxID=28002 RepID=A0AA86UZK7_9EUKA|nr:BPI-like protein [Hexamita inflata]